MAKKILIAYYSRRGENYVNGSIRNLKFGNTEVVAAKIKALLPKADVFQIDTTYEYSKSYMTCIEEAKQELHDQARPEVKNPLESIEEYDTIILGYPNWWGTMPMVCYTFLESYDFTGKRIIPSAPTRAAAWGRASTSSRNSVLGLRSWTAHPSTVPRLPTPTARPGR